MAVIATVGTARLGSIDPLDAINEIAHAHSLWVHVDAAYGGFFILTEEGKRKIKGKTQTFTKLK